MYLLDSELFDVALNFTGYRELLYHVDAVSLVITK
jgi:hypothetical protein